MRENDDRSCGPSPLLFKEGVRKASELAGVVITMNLQALNGERNIILRE
jgi:hypothetical protein